MGGSGVQQVGDLRNGVPPQSCLTPLPLRINKKVDDDIGAGEIGLRVAWKDTGNRLSLTDFSVGCQYFDHCIAPTVSVGFAIWGVPVAVGLCIVACAAEGMM